MKNTAVDTGPLVALFDRDDVDHERTKAFFAKTDGAFVTNWIVIGEATYLLDFNLQTQQTFFWLGLRKPDHG